MPFYLFFLVKRTFVLEWVDLQTDCRDGPGSSHSPAVPYLAMSVCQNWDMRIANAPSHQLPPNAFSCPGIQLGKAELEVKWGCSCWGSKQAKARLGEGLKMAASKSNPRATLAGKRYKRKLPVMREAGVIRPYLQAPIAGVEGEAKEKRRDYHHGGGGLRTERGWTQFNCTLWVHLQWAFSPRESLNHFVQMWAVLTNVKEVCAGFETLYCLSYCTGACNP